MKNTTPLLLLGITIFAVSSASAVTTTFTDFSGTGIGGGAAATHALTTRSRIVDVDADGTDDFEFTWNQEITLNAGVNVSSNLLGLNIGDTIDVFFDRASFTITNLNTADFTNVSVAFDSYSNIRLRGNGATLDVNGAILTNTTNGNTDHATPVDPSVLSYTITGLQNGTSASGGGFNYAITYTTLPEPSSIALLSLGGLALLIRRRR